MLTGRSKRGKQKKMLACVSHAARDEICNICVVPHAACYSVATAQNTTSDTPDKWQMQMHPLDAFGMFLAILCATPPRDVIDYAGRKMDMEEASDYFPLELFEFNDSFPFEPQLDY